jgi:DNA-directed RNA polymerase subunit RPC12/RpoP
MPIEFRCPNCEKKLRTGDDKAGKTAKCPQCGTPVVVPAATQVATDFEPFPAFDDDIEDRAGLPPARTSRSRAASEVACPMCGAMNDAAAPRCLSCGEELDAAVALQGGKPSLYFGDVWQSAWEKWSANLGLCVASILIAFLMVMVGYGVLIFVVIFGVGIVGAAGGGNNAGPALVGMFVAMAVGYLCMLFLVAYIQLGLSNFSIQLARRHQGNLGDMFPPVHKLAAAIVCGIAVFVIMMIAMAPGMAAQIGGQAMVMKDNNAGIPLVILGYGLQIAGSLAVQSIVWPIPYLIADRRTGLFAALIDGPKLGVYNRKLSLLLVIVNTALMLAGALTCGVGLLFTYSLSFLLFAVAFDRLKRYAQVP